MPIYRNKETGHEVEVMPGTRLPKVYEKVEHKTGVQPKTQQTESQNTGANTKKTSTTKGNKSGKGGKENPTTVAAKNNDNPADDAVKE